MQTFLPYQDFIESAKCLDMRRLGKQRVEAWQIYLALTKEDYGWKNHPAVKMWRGYSICLLLYGMHICDEWINRGYKDSMKGRFVDAYFRGNIAFGISTPPWIGDPDFHESHKSNLLRKDPNHYRQFFPDVPDNLEYVWPVK